MGDRDMTTFFLTTRTTLLPPHEKRLPFTGEKRHFRTYKPKAVRGGAAQPQAGVYSLGTKSYKQGNLKADDDYIFAEKQINMNQ